MDNTHTFHSEPLKRAIEAIVLAGGSDAREAKIVAENLVTANLTGHDSHGVGMIPRYIESLQEGVTADDFWGIPYRCRDLEQTARQLVGRGVSMSEIRAGRKPGSLVATVKSHCLGIPTLLLQP